MRHPFSITNFGIPLSFGTQINVYCIIGLGQSVDYIPPLNPYFYFTMSSSGVIVRGY